MGVKLIVLKLLKTLVICALLDIKHSPAPRVVYVIKHSRSCSKYSVINEYVYDIH